MRFVVTLAAILALWCGTADGRHRHRPTRYRVKATAFATSGVTKAGGDTHFGIVAADPALLPLGTRIRVRGAGRYSGTYIVTDTGSRINGREIDIYIPNRAEAKRFGERMVHIQVLKWGDLKPNELARK